MQKKTIGTSQIRVSLKQSPCRTIRHAALKTLNRDLGTVGTLCHTEFIVDPNTVQTIRSLHTTGPDETHTARHRITLSETKNRFFSHRYLIEVYETNRMSHVPLLYDVVNLLN